jgi:arsenate reductase
MGSVQLTSRWSEDGEKSFEVQSAHVENAMKARYIAMFLLGTVAACSRAENERREAPSGKADQPGMQLAKFTPRTPVYAKLQQYIDDILPNVKSIPEERQRELKRLALFIKTKRESKEIAQLLFICTHNSRRSHIGQIWAAVAAAYYGVDNVKTFSGGTEATAFNPRAVAAMERAGFKVEKPAGENPHYQVTFSDKQPALECFSKKYDDAINPQSNFAATMTCAQADKNCPVVAGASLRVPLHYEDPKAADGTPQETAIYDERTRQIATEMFYLFSQVKS